MRKYLFIAFFILAGCATTGVHVSTDQVNGFKKGKTTYEQVIAALGEPTTRSQDSDGNVTAEYAYSQYKTRPETFIPYVGAFVGGSDVKVNTARFEFTPSGILKNYNFSESNYGTTMNAGSAQADTGPHND